MKIIAQFFILISITSTKCQNISQYIDTKSRMIDTPMNISVRKCHCDAGQIYVSHQCRDFETFIPVLFSFHPLSSKIYNTRTINIKMISKVTCKPNQLLVPLKAGSFYIFSNGSLFHIFTGLFYETKDYCIEHVIGRRGNARLDALVCINRPLVPRCCPDKYIFDVNSFTCKYNLYSVFSPTIIKEPAILKWLTIGGPYVGFPDCTETEVYKKVNLEDRGAADLLYRSNGIFLHWKRSTEIFPDLIGPDHYCVAVEERKGNFEHSAFYCNEPLSLKTLASTLYRNLNKSMSQSYLISFVVYPLVNN